MSSTFCLIKHSQLFSFETLDAGDFRSRSLFKSLSIYLSKRAGLPVPSTVVIVDDSADSVELALDVLGLPVMLRMDYARLPAQKFLGGIPLYSKAATQRASSFLQRNGFCPLLQTNIQRTDDLYSVGMTISTRNPIIEIEVVGRGFDASDLRLGATVPHERLSLNIHSDEIMSRTVIRHEQYLELVKWRASACAAFTEYVQLVNERGCLLSSLKTLVPHPEHVLRHSEAMPRAYTPIGKRSIEFLCDVAREVIFNVAGELPDSTSLVVSMSHVRAFGWLLWDIYGHWYQR